MSSVALGYGNGFVFLCRTCIFKIDMNIFTVMIQVAVFLGCDITTCLHQGEDGDSVVLQNIGFLPYHYVVLQCRRL
jgi:hypothetical protein